MKVAGMMIILIGLVLILVISTVKPGNRVHNWSPVNGMIIMGIGAVVYIAGVKIKTSEVYPLPEKKQQYYL